MYLLSFYSKLLNNFQSKTLVNQSDYEEIPIQWNNHPRGVFVTLIRSTNESMYRVINMIHSVVLFHSTTNQFHYPFLIFHEQSLTLSMRQYILSCILNSNRTVHISFVLIHFQRNIQLPKNFLKRKDTGYHLMCRFWSYDVFYHPMIVKNNFEYLIRMDDDSYFIDRTNEDLFQCMIHKKLDYLYRSWYNDINEGLYPIEKLFFNRTLPRTNCIYNNFFLIRLQWFYRSERIQRFLHELIRDDLILREYIADGCIHAAWMDIDQQMKTEEFKGISYGHNYHIVLVNNSDSFYNQIPDFYTQMINSCYQLIVINNRGNRAKRIKIS
ncbi:hypothetical protein I4U23_004462 [Adineta vaga]|nr:hypothetical protein I4U23_004462 [Adineta vaga]